MIEIKGLCAGYGSKEVLKDLSLNIEKGSLTSLIGINGSGKSTLLKAASGIISYTGGTVTVDGKDIRSYRRGSLAKRVSYLSQWNNAPDMTVFELVLQGRFPHLSFPRSYSAEDRSIAESALSEVGISHLKDSRLSSLSGGTRQLAYLAMSLTQNTDYILLDEPTTYLDISNRLSLMKLLRKVRDGGRGVLTVMHELPIALTYSDKIALISEGRVVNFGTPIEIYESGDIEKNFGVSIKYESGEFFHKLT